MPKYKKSLYRWKGEKNGMKEFKLEKCGLLNAEEIDNFAVYEDSMVELTSPAWSNALKVVLNLLPAASIAL